MTLPQLQEPSAFEEYVAPTSLKAALEAMADGAATCVAGGTDLWVQKDEPGRTIGKRLVNIKHVPELAGITETAGGIRLGALVTMTQVLDSALLRKMVPVLPATADKFASVQIRNAATVGGNVANASPAADFVIPLLCLDAVVALASLKAGKVATRTIPIAEIFTGPGRTKMVPGELITGVKFAVPKAGFHAGFAKTGPRPALEIALVSLGFAAYLDGTTMRDVRLALGAVAPTPIRAHKTEAVLEGQTIDAELIERASDALDKEIAPIDDHRGSAWYRRRLARAYLTQELSNAVAG
ncbi:MAG TPA: xanthine dehydrogenase family protein subunit M [Alphaproteobacteria bacterium]|nr:xanthine dehydrogenase family protein subunit M [Alphaproteobacteria bacterium]